MSISTSAGSYRDCYEAFDKAIEDDKGVRIRMPNLDVAYQFRQRCHYARKLDREKNRETYEPEHPLYGTSAYDPITLKIRRVGNSIYIYFEKNDRLEMEVESLSVEAIEDTPETPTYERVTYPRVIPAEAFKDDIAAPTVAASSSLRRL